MPCRYNPRMFTTVSRALLLIGALSLGCCGAATAAAWGFGPPSNVAAEVSPNLPKYELRRIGIIAFANQSGTPDAGVRVASLFFHELEARHRFEVTPPLRLDEATALAFTRTAQAGPEEERPDRLRRFVRQWLGRMWPSAAQASEATDHDQPQAWPGSTHQPAAPLDAVLTGVIIRYEDRHGTALAVDRPASVAYDAYLISTSDGEMLWRARFDETQKPLLDNLLLVGRFLQGGGVWQTSETLTRIGLERVLKTFPGIAPSALP
jgi:hypothetical protein